MDNPPCYHGYRLQKNKKNWIYLLRPPFNIQTKMSNSINDISIGYSQNNASTMLGLYINGYSITLSSRNTNNGPITQSNTTKQKKRPSKGQCKGQYKGQYKGNKTNAENGYNGFNGLGELMYHR